MNSKMIPVAVINPDAPSDCLEAKQPEIDNGTAVYDKSGYFSSGFMAQEWDRIWTRSWLLAGVLSDIPETGDYFLFRIRHESLSCPGPRRVLALSITSAPTADPAC